MAEAFAKFRVGTPGTGASQASYITRESALEPGRHRNLGGQLELNFEENGVDRTLNEDLNDLGLGGEPTQDEDPVWTWNAPEFLTGDDYGRTKTGTSRSASDVVKHDA